MMREIHTSWFGWNLDVSEWYKTNEVSRMEFSGMFTEGFGKRIAGKVWKNDNAVYILLSQQSFFMVLLSFLLSLAASTLLIRNTLSEQKVLQNDRKFDQLATDSQHLVLAASFSNLLKLWNAFKHANMHVQMLKGYNQPKLSEQRRDSWSLRKFLGEDEKTSKHCKTVPLEQTACILWASRYFRYLSSLEENANSPWPLRQPQDLAERKEPPGRGASCRTHMGSLADRKMHRETFGCLSKRLSSNFANEQLANHQWSCSYLFMMALQRSTKASSRLWEIGSRKPNTKSLGSLSKLPHTSKAGKELIGISRLKTRQKYQDTKIHSRYSIEFQLCIFQLEMLAATRTSKRVQRPKSCRSTIQVLTSRVGWHSLCLIVATLQCWLCWEQDLYKFTVAPCCTLQLLHGQFSVRIEEHLLFQWRPHAESAEFALLAHRSSVTSPCASRKPKDDMSFHDTCTVHAILNVRMCAVGSWTNFDT